MCINNKDVTSYLIVYTFAADYFINWQRRQIRRNIRHLGQTK